ncbi:MAG: hypothetical protein QY318_03895 [Candidatus Dojkabacteria bacterium]|nr:MAG: hypothetical protein QY318_03895 [Candidatus Dojkabacteria bacterium]
MKPGKQQTPLWRGDTGYLTRQETEDPNGCLGSPFEFITKADSREAGAARRVLIAELLNITDEIAHPLTGKLSPGTHAAVARREFILQAAIGLGLLTEREGQALVNPYILDDEVIDIYEPHREKWDMERFVRRSMYERSQSRKVGLLLFYKQQYISTLEAFLCRQAAMSCGYLICATVSDSSLGKVLRMHPKTTEEYRLATLSQIPYTENTVISFEGNIFDGSLQRQIMELGVDHLFLPTANIMQVRDYFAGFRVSVRPGAPTENPGYLDPTNIFASYSGGLLKNWRFRQLPESTTKPFKKVG